jgi:MFS family permease
MLTGSVAGGFIAQITNLGVPYIVRAAVLAVAFFVALATMHDIGFTPMHGKNVAAEVRTLVRGAIDSGFRNPPIRWLMLSAPFQTGVGFYAFYAMQPHLLELYGDRTAFGIAGLAAAVTAGAQIGGGLLVPKVRKLFRRRTDLLLWSAILSSGSIALVGLIDNFWTALVFFIGWAAMFSLSGPVRQAFINSCIPSEQRATVLSFDAVMGSAGGVVAQPVLGRVADSSGYPASYVVSAAIFALSAPFVWLARREKAPGDLIAEPSSETPVAGA